MRRMKNIHKGTPISFSYLKPGHATEVRTGIIDRVFRSKGKSSNRDYRGKQLIVFTIIDGDTGKPKSYHFNKMADIRVAR